MLLLELQAPPVISVECAQKHGELEHGFPEGRDRNDRFFVPKRTAMAQHLLPEAMWHRLALSLFENTKTLVADEVRIAVCNSKNECCTVGCS